MSSNSEQNCEVQLAAEIEVLKSALADKHTQLLAMESACLQESDRQVELEDSIIAWQDKYERLYESHKRVQKLNQNLEDKLLKLVDRNSGERAQLTSDVATLSVRLAQANYNIQSLKREIERYKTDISVAIQLLQCKPDSFVSPKLSSLPIEIQSKVATYMRLDTNSHSDSEGSTSGVGMATTNSYHVLPASDSPPPICPFPPTAMVYSMRGLDGNQDGQPGSKQGTGRDSTAQQEATLVVPLGGSAPANSTDSLLGDSRSLAPPNGQNVVSPSVMAKFLEDELKSSDALLGTPIKHCDTCVCTHGNNLPGTTESRLHESGSLLLADLLGSDQKYYSVATQTLIKGETNNSLCLRCSSNLNSPSHNNSPYMMKLIKSSDSVISETKSSVSDYLTTPDKVSPTGGGGGGGGGPGSGTNGSALPNCDIGSGGDGDSSEPLSLLVSTKKDDLMVNPILGHHRLVADRTVSLTSNTADQHHNHPQQQTQQQHTKLGAKLAASQLPVKKPGLPGGESSFKQSVKPPVCGGAGVGQMTPQLNRTTDGTSTAQQQPKFSHDSPSYIIKDTDQMSGSHATPISSTGNGALGQTGKYGTSASGSVGSGLYHTVGSTNSLWSRTSSKDPEKDGAKMFEIFNRNLIKTIKAENPKMSGPRICALRIQNGSSNILLDNLVDDSFEGLHSKPPTPVMYTRRAKFLDEELLLDDDPSIGLNGAIKTTNLPTATSSADSIPPAGFNKTMVTPNKSSTTGGGAGGGGAGSGAVVPGDAGTDGHGNLISGTINRVDEGGGGVAHDGGVDPSVSKQVCNMSTTTSPHSSDRLCTIGEEVSNLLINTKLGASGLAKPRLDINVNKLEGIDVTSKKSCTQSSSISSEIDIQESAILRRQQLSRVAEWVQNNSKLGNAEPLSNTESDNEPTAGLAISDSLNNNATVAVAGKASIRPSVLAGSAKGGNGVVGGCEIKQPTGSDMKVGRHLHSYGTTSAGTTNLLNNNNGIGMAGYGSLPFAQHHGGTNTSKPGTGIKHGYNNNLNSSLTSTAGPSVLDYNSNTTTNVSSAGLGAIRKGTTMLRDSALTECLIDEANRLSSVDHSGPVDHDDDGDSSSVDLAQMEYNVKQFLLKQNEWSTVHTRRQSLISSSASSVKGNGRTEDRPVRDPCKGLFPGMAVAQQTASYHQLHTGAVGNTSASNAYGNSHKYPINPHRTETNL
ncbi:uncharacterized protein LOC126561442 isoform X2 [Anopheles maculipalpis]|uniref:uncharacterized protein LOC126561442 isoform X2 n=1 Tax=Anopheles maculipalpis TaxID=1496333 RepID=UPI0021595A5E|nr:uncharacterized protein LOC126561442 isoform X2 [Anopheles maculipalpis]